MSEMTIFRQRTFQTVDASGFVDLFHAINVRFTSVISVYAHLFPFQFLPEGTMRRERALKIVLVLVGLLFSALAYPLTMFVRQEPALAMMLSVYVTLGVFLLLAARNPSGNCSLIAFTAWSSLAHAALMAVQAFRDFIARGELVGVAVLTIIGVALIVLAPAKQSGELASAAGA
jgi:hypothetical protein